MELGEVVRVWLVEPVEDPVPAEEEEPAAPPPELEPAVAAAGA